MSDVAVNVRVENDQMITDSRNVAECFGKRHDHVLRDIENIKNSLPNFGERNFGQMFFETMLPDESGRGKVYRTYLMNRDGFTLLAMGFTGAEAMQWKLRYIEAFNELERAWNSPEMIMKRALEIANANVKKLTLENSELKVSNQIMRPKAEYYDELVDRQTSLSIRETAKELQVRERAFVAFLLKNKYLYRDKRGKLMPFAEHVANEIFVLKECRNDKSKWSGTQLLVTVKGRDIFRTLHIAA